MRKILRQTEASDSNRFMANLKNCKLLKMRFSTT